MSQSRFGGVGVPAEISKDDYYDPYAPAPRKRGTLATGAGLGGIAVGAGMANASARLTETAARARTRDALAGARKARKATAGAAANAANAKKTRAQRKANAAYRSALVDSSRKTNYAISSVNHLRNRKARRIKLGGGGALAAAGGAGLLALGMRQRRDG